MQLQTSASVASIAKTQPSTTKKQNTRAAFNVNGVVSANGHLLKTGLAGMAGYYAKEVPYQMAQGINGAIRGIEKKLAGGRKARMMM